MTPWTRRRATVLLHGDSITQRSFRAGGWGARLAAAYAEGRKADVLNRGLSGYNTRWALEGLADCSEAGVALATVFFGANDAALEGLGRQHVPLDEYRANVARLVAHWRAAGARVVVLTPPPVDEAGVLAHQVREYGEEGATGVNERLNDTTRQYAAAAAAAAAEAGAACCVDLWALMTAEDGWQAMLDDGLHLSDAGNEFVFRALLRAIEESVPELAPDALRVHMPLHREISVSQPGSSFSEECS